MQTSETTCLYMMLTDTLWIKGHDCDTSPNHCELALHPASKSWSLQTLPQKVGHLASFLKNFVTMRGGHDQNLPSNRLLG